VTVIAPDVSPQLVKLAEAGSIDLVRRHFEVGDLTGSVLVIGATDSRTTNEEIARHARESGILCNIVDEPDLCDFITPALVIRGELQIGISTGGGSPTLAQRVKREIAAIVGEEYGELLELATEMRQEAKKTVSDFETRRDLLRAFVESEAIDLIREGRSEEARDIARNFLRGSHANGNESAFGEGDRHHRNGARGESHREDSRMGDHRIW
jgi:siroheme synthase-like protein